MQALVPSFSGSLTSDSIAKQFLPSFTGSSSSKSNGEQSIQSFAGSLTSESIAEQLIPSFWSHRSNGLAVEGSLNNFLVQSPSINSMDSNSFTEHENQISADPSLISPPASPPFVVEQSTAFGSSTDQLATIVPNTDPISLLFQQSPRFENSEFFTFSQPLQVLTPTCSTSNTPIVDEILPVALMPLSTATGVETKKRGPYRKLGIPVIRICTRCGTDSTPTWRCTKTRKLVCNACGLWLKKNEHELGSLLQPIQPIDYLWALLYILE